MQTVATPKNREKLKVFFFFFIIKTGIFSRVCKLLLRTFPVQLQSSFKMFMSHRALPTVVSFFSDCFYYLSSGNLATLYHLIFFFFFFLASCSLHVSLFFSSCSCTSNCLCKCLYNYNFKYFHCAIFWFTYSLPAAAHTML